MLSIEQLQKFERDGYLVIENFIPEETIPKLIDEANKLVSEYNAQDITIFTTEEQQRNSNEYFLSSGDKIRFFWEENAFNKDGSSKQDKLLSINKIGHALHELDPVFRDFSHCKKMQDLVASLGLKEALVVQSMYIFKQPRIGGKVGLHQDSPFLYTDPLTAIGFWFAFQDATKNNGCLWIWPGSHKYGLSRRFVRNKDGTGTEWLDMPKHPDFPTWEESKLIPVEVKKGTCIILHGSVVHMSYENKSNESRHAYTLHVIDGTAKYPENNWLQRPKENPFRGFIPLSK